MSHIVINEDQDHDQVATNLGWSEFCEWAQTLDADDYFEIRHLCEHGWEQDVDDLKEQLIDALADHPPSDDVSHTAKALVGFLTRYPSEVIMITNGAGPD